LHGSAEYRAHLIGGDGAARGRIRDRQNRDIGNSWLTKARCLMTASALPKSVDAMLELLSSRGYLAEPLAGRR